MIPYDMMKAMADERIQRYRDEAEQHRRSIDREKGSNLLERLMQMGRQGLDRSGVRRVGDVIAGREVRPAV